MSPYNNGGNTSTTNCADGKKLDETTTATKGRSLRTLQQNKSQRTHMRDTMVSVLFWLPKDHYILVFYDELEAYLNQF